MNKDYEKKMATAFLMSFMLLIVAFFILPKMKPQTVTTTTVANAVAVTNISDGVTNIESLVMTEDSEENSVPEISPIQFTQTALATNISIEFEGETTLLIDTYGASISDVLLDGEWNQYDYPVTIASPSNMIPICDLYIGDLESLLKYEERPVYSVVESESNSVLLATQFEYQGAQLELTRKYTVTSNYGVTDEISVRNLSDNMIAIDDNGVSFTVASMFSFFPKEEANPRNRIQFRYYDGNKLNEVLKSKLFGNKETDSTLVSPEWITHSDNYFIAVMDPEGATFNGEYSIEFEEKTYREVAMGLENSALTLNSGETKSFSIVYFMGPKKDQLLKANNPTFAKISAWPAAFNWFMKPITWLIEKGMFLLSKIIPNWGLVIIVLALIIKLLLSPLSIRAAISMRKTQLAQPKLKNIQEKYKDNQQMQQQKTMEYYKKEGINPLGGCWPMLLQIPVFFSLFRVLSNSVELKGAKFLWIKDLTLPDTLFTMNVPLLPNQFNLLPIIMTVLQLVSTRLQMGRTKKMGAGAQQNNPMNSYLMPVMFLFLFWNMPAGLVLYWTIQNIYTIIEQEFINTDKQIKLK